MNRLISAKTYTLHLSSNSSITPPTQKSLGSTKNNVIVGASNNIINYGFGHAAGGQIREFSFALTPGSYTDATFNTELIRCFATNGHTIAVGSEGGTGNMQIVLSTPAATPFYISSTSTAASLFGFSSTIASTFVSPSGRLTFPITAAQMTRIVVPTTLNSFVITTTFQGTTEDTSITIPPGIYTVEYMRTALQFQLRKKAADFLVLLVGGKFQISTASLTQFILKVPAANSVGTILGWTTALTSTNQSGAQLIYLTNAPTQHIYIYSEIDTKPSIPSCSQVTWPVNWNSLFGNTRGLCEVSVALKSKSILDTSKATAETSVVYPTSSTYITNPPQT